MPSSAQSRTRAGHPTQLDKGIAWHRDPATSELHVVRRAENAPVAGDEPRNPHTLRVRTQMVAVTCTVATPDGTAVPGLRREDFRIFDDGLERPISYFDASTQPASVALVIDASPSVLRDSDEMKQAAGALIGALAPLDRAAVVDFAAHTYLQLGFSDVREEIRRAVARVNVKDLLADTGGSNIYEAVYLAAHELFPGRTGRKAILLLTDGQDSGLGLTLDPATEAPRPGRAGDRLTFDDVARLLAEQDIQLFAVSTENRPKIMTPDWLAAHENATLVNPSAHAEGIPPYTLYLAELVRRAGGQLYFLRETATMADTFRQIAAKIRAEYTLGFYPVSEGDNECGAVEGRGFNPAAAGPPSSGVSTPEAGDVSAAPCPTLSNSARLGSANEGLPLPTGQPDAMAGPPRRSPEPFGAKAGWHSLHIEVADQPNARVSHRAAYYVPGEQ